MVNLPKRYGFEFGRLEEALYEKIENETVPTAVRDIIYHLDMGYFLPNSDVVCANLDEPIDEGVVTEISYVKLMGKYVLGIRTDVRNPYATSQDNLGGIHFFPAYQADKILRYQMPSKTPSTREEEITALVEKIDASIKEAGITYKNNIPEYVINNPNLNSVLERAHLLFKGIKDFHSEEGLKELTPRYIENRQSLDYGQIE